MPVEPGIPISERTELPKADIEAGFWFPVVDTSAGSSGGKKFDACGVVWTAKGSTINDSISLFFGDMNDGQILWNESVNDRFLVVAQNGILTLKHNAQMGSGEIEIDNNSHGYDTICTNEDAGGVNRETLRLDPDSESAKVLILRLTERAAPGPDVAGEAQLWLKNTVPNELWFRDDAGTDRKVALV